MTQTKYHLVSFSSEPTLLWSLPGPEDATRRYSVYTDCWPSYPAAVQCEHKNYETGKRSKIRTHVIMTSQVTRPVFLWLSTEGSGGLQEPFFPLSNYCRKFCNKYILCKFIEIVQPPYFDVKIIIFKIVLDIIWI